MDTTAGLLADFPTTNEPAANIATTLQDKVSVPLETLGNDIVARIAIGDKNRARADDMYLSAGRQLIEAKERVPNFKAFLRNYCNGLSRSRAYELINIANGKAQEVRSTNRDRDRRRREKAAGVREPRTRGFSIKKTQAPKSQVQDALAQFIVAVDIWFSRMDDEAKREAVAYAVSKAQARTQ